MNPLMQIGAILLVVGLLVFSLKLITYNRQKYTDEDPYTAPGKSTDRNPTLRILALVILIFALVIFAFLSR